MVNHHLPEVHSALWDSLRRISPQTKWGHKRSDSGLLGSLRSSDLGEKGGWLKRKSEKTFSFFVHELLLNWYTMHQQKGLLHFWPLLLDTFLPAEQIDVQSFIQAAFRPDFVRHLIFIRIKIWWETTSGRSDQSNHKIAANVLLASNFASTKKPQNHAVALVGSRLAGSGRSSNIQP